MPGSVSDSRDPEFGTGANACDVKDGIQEVIDIATFNLGTNLKNIVEVTHGEPGPIHSIEISDRHLRLMRFGLLRVLENW